MRIMRIRECGSLIRFFINYYYLPSPRIGVSLTWGRDAGVWAFCGRYHTYVEDIGQCSETEGNNNENENLIVQEV